MPELILEIGCWSHNLHISTIVAFAFSFCTNIRGVKPAVPLRVGPFSFVPMVLHAVPARLLNGVVSYLAVF